MFGRAADSKAGGVEPSETQRCNLLPSFPPAKLLPRISPLARYGSTAYTVRKRQQGQENSDGNNLTNRGSPIAS